MRVVRRRPASHGRLFAMPLVGHIALLLVTAIFLAVVLGVGLWWAIGQPSITTGKPWTAKETFDFVKIVLAIVGGIGAVVALVVAYRKQRLGEAAEKRQEAAEAREDARLFGEDFARATEQLGSTEAPVRLAGMYTLERLGQDTPTQQQTIVNVLCAYLRMPYAPPSSDAASDQGENERRKHEREVRLTAQRILASNLRSREESNNRTRQRWKDIDLNLAGATLIDFSFHNCKINIALFRGAQFSGNTWFKGVEFDGDVSFDGAQFDGDAAFGGAQFDRDVWFEGVQFDGTAGFRAAQFDGLTAFEGARFGDAAFEKARFGGDAAFERAQFGGLAGFEGAQFDGTAGFRAAQFDGTAAFNEAQFDGDAGFEGAHFNGTAGFREAQFDGDAGFRGAQFDGDAAFKWAKFDGTAAFRGTQFNDGAWFEGAQFGGTAGFRGAQFRQAVKVAQTRVRLDVAESVLCGRIWPQGYDVTRSTILEDERLPGREGRWGYLRLVDPDGLSTTGFDNPENSDGVPAS